MKKKNHISNSQTSRVIFQRNIEIGSHKTGGHIKHFN